MTVEAQVHGRFKVFSGKVQADKTLGPLADEVAAFASTVAAKSIGVESIRSAGLLVVSLGYRDDEPAYTVTLECVAEDRTDRLRRGPQLPFDSSVVGRP